MPIVSVTWCCSTQIQSGPSQFSNPFHLVVFFPISFPVGLLQNHPDVLLYQPSVRSNDSLRHHSIQCLWQKILCNAGLRVNAHAHRHQLGTLKENCQGVQLGSIRSANQRETCLWRPGGSLPYWRRSHTRVIFSSPHLPGGPGSSPVQAELAFSLGPQSRVCSQLSTSNTEGTEGKASRREQRNTMGKANVLHLLWVIWSGVHFLVYIWNQGARSANGIQAPRTNALIWEFKNF